jgi:hypothetical protein
LISNKSIQKIFNKNNTINKYIERLKSVKTQTTQKTQISEKDKGK